MKLSDYLMNRGRGSQTLLAIAINGHRPDISDWARGLRICPEKHCVAIEQATNGQVTRKDLRPSDWWLIWPELIEPDSHEIA